MDEVMWGVCRILTNGRPTGSRNSVIREYVGILFAGHKTKQ